ncbi:nucleotidyltransferase domain-containing protein [Sporosarcina sp. ACRSM]|uniref:type VII toxin-antitoxin system MntA family adenylyltransferase antitoxin n=1 Tax=Sporosarcina sp. ACRSM TaxID=2918216 RepID=UPI001EF4DF8A|nr:nucleotidyltransferase domain-containing protein [Sporosarcina sp. ACRSM]MCG7334330.1 nucleotidyltransferase domain-containing protein [Sporosarcina sp. ACRSM]
MNDALINQIIGIANSYPEIQSVLLFGSRAHGDFTERSDIDLAVKAPELSEMKWLLLTEQVENEIDTLLKIDVVLYDHASEALREQIDECHKVIYQTSNSRS